MYNKTKININNKNKFILKNEICMCIKKIILFYNKILIMKTMHVLTFPIWIFLLLYGNVLEKYGKKKVKHNPKSNISKTF